MVLLGSLAIEIEGFLGGGLHALAGLVSEAHDVEGERIAFGGKRLGEPDRLFVFAVREGGERFPCGGLSFRLADFLHRGVGLTHDGGVFARVK